MCLNGGGDDGADDDDGGDGGMVKASALHSIYPTTWRWVYNTSTIAAYMWNRKARHGSSMMI